MRTYRETTARNLLRTPLPMGVPVEGLFLVTGGTLLLFIVGAGTRLGDVGSIVFAVVGYGLLRVIHHFSRTGWQEGLVFKLEQWAEWWSRKLDRKKWVDLQSTPLQVSPSSIRLLAFDTLEEADFVAEKEFLIDELARVKAGEDRVLVFRTSDQGSVLHEVLNPRVKSDPPSLLNESALQVLGKSYRDLPTYSLYRLPVSTDPLWLTGILRELPPGSCVLIRMQGLDRQSIKKRIEHARRSNSQHHRALTDVDAEVTFEESSFVLEGLSRGEESVCRIALVIVSGNKSELSLDSELFIKEKTQILAVASALGARKRFHRSHLVRLVTASDLIPQFTDPMEDGIAILRSVRGAPLYFSPQDSRLEALHWLVVGASGSGKSFFTGLVLKRLIEGFGGVPGTPMSVFFVDHNRSFRRLCRSNLTPYIEPESLLAVDTEIPKLFDHWNQPGSISGIELSDLSLAEKKSAIFSVLTKIEVFLRHRETTHPFYLVLDECWALMREHPILVQRAFREYRKMNGAVVAITQSLRDFLSDESGQSIFQNAPIRILLRQGEDLGPYQGVLGLNSVELKLAKRLRQKKGEFSECLIKTPFLSKLGRLYPTDLEHACLRTDDLRQEMIEEKRQSRMAVPAAEVTC